MKAKPNILIILADQLRACSVGYAGEEPVITPHLDRLAAESVVLKTAVSPTPVCTPYRGSMLTGRTALSLEVQIMFANMPGTLQHVKTGRLRVLGVTTQKRSPLLPDVPTISEAGVPGFHATTWFGVFAPAGTPPAVIARLNAEFAKALATD